MKISQMARAYKTRLGRSGDGAVEMGRSGDGAKWWWGEVVRGEVTWGEVEMGRSDYKSSFIRYVKIRVDRGRHFLPDFCSALCVTRAVDVPVNSHFDWLSAGNPLRNHMMTQRKIPFPFPTFDFSIRWTFWPSLDELKTPHVLTGQILH